MSDIWENIGVVLKIETHNFHCDLPYMKKERKIKDC